MEDQGLLKVQKKMNALLEKNKKLQEEKKALKDKVKEHKHTHSRVSKLPKPEPKPEGETPPPAPNPV